MATVEPVPDAPAAVAEADARILVVADYHAGIESALRYEGVEVRSHAGERRERLLALLDRTGAEEVVFLGDLAHRIGEPGDAEREELEALLSAVTDRASATLVKGNHDGDLEEVVGIPVTDADGLRRGDLGFVHGHTWPAPEVLAADTVCVGHEHPTVRLEDAVGGRRIEPAWLRGPLAPETFADHADPATIGGELVLMPAFNRLSGGTWVNVAGQEFLSPFLPEGIASAEAYLLDGTRLGDYRRV